MCGALIYVNNYKFKLLECDEYTKKYMTSNRGIFRDADIGEVGERIRIGRFRFNGGDLEDYLVHLLHTIDKEGSDWVRAEDILEGLRAFDISLTEMERYTLFDKLRQNHEGKYSMEDFYNCLVNN